MRIIRCCSLIILTIILSSCGINSENMVNIKPSPLQNVEKVYVKSFETERLKSLQIDLNTAEIFFTSWGKKEVNIEIDTSVSGSSKKDELDKSMQDGGLQVDFENDMLSIKEPVNSKTKNIRTSNKIRISAPCEIRNTTISVKNGNFTSSGDFITSAGLKLENGNVNIARFQGLINAEVNRGNIGISSGRLNGSSRLMSKSGNINIKTEILTKDNYKFEVDTGNIELSLPARISGDFSVQGNLVTNDFKSSPNSSKILVSSKQGSIVLKKY